MAKKSDRLHHLIPVFVEFIPERLEPGCLYVSMEYGAVAHLCACGCESKVNTPLTPTDWSLKYDGEAVTLSPSIGNWSRPCRSHYFITANRVRWAAAWSEEKIRQGRALDRETKRQHYMDGKDENTKTADDSLKESTWLSVALAWFRE